MATAGFQVFDAAGHIVIDTNSVLGRLLGVISVGTSSSSQVDSNLLRGTPFWTIYPLSPSSGVVVPTVSVATSTISWTWPINGASYNTPCSLIYGIK